MWHYGGQHSPGPNLRSRRPSALHPTLFQRRGVKTHVSRGRESVANRCYITAPLLYPLVALTSNILTSSSLCVVWKCRSTLGSSKLTLRAALGILTWSLQSVQLVSPSWKGNQSTVRTAEMPRGHRISQEGRVGLQRKPPGSAACLLCTIAHSFVPSSWLPHSQCLTWFC